MRQFYNEQIRILIAYYSLPENEDAVIYIFFTAIVDFLHKVM